MFKWCVLTYALHLEQADADHGGLKAKSSGVHFARTSDKQKPTQRAHLGVIAPLETVDEARRDCNDVLERASETDTEDVAVDGDAELFRLKQARPLLGHVEVPAPDRRLGELFASDLVGDVGAREGSAFDPESGRDDFAKDVDLALFDIDALDERDALRAGLDLALELVAGLADELGARTVCVSPTS